MNTMHAPGDTVPAVPSAQSMHCAGLPASPLPADRLARIAARRAFVDLKQEFIRAVAPLREERGRWLRAQVRAAEEPEDLLLLRGHVLASLSGPDEGRMESRQRLRRSLDALFPDSTPRNDFVSV